MSSPKPTGATSPKSPQNPESPKSPKSPTSPTITKSANAAEGPVSVSTRGPATETFLPASRWTEADLPDDVDSAIGDDRASSTASITSSLLAYRVVNGRTYHAERGNASYWAANDETQSEASDMLDHVCRLHYDGALYKAPLEKDKLTKALDIGTGTGVWAVDFADEFPDCEVIGTDISPIQPRWVPPNLKFEIEDCTQTWTFPDNSFDYVHIRLLYGSIQDWEALFDEAYRVLKPGGWLESHEASPMAYCDDGTLPDDSALAQWGKFFFEGGEKLGRTFKLVENDIQPKNMERLGMEKVSIFDMKTPLGTWPKDPVMNEIGRFTMEVLYDAEGWITYIADMVQGWTPTQVGAYCAHFRAEHRNTKIHSYFKQRAVWGQKPEENVS